MVINTSSFVTMFVCPSTRTEHESSQLSCLQSLMIDANMCTQILEKIYAPHGAITSLQSAFD